MSGLGRLFGRGEPGEARRREVRAAGGCGEAVAPGRPESRVRGAARPPHVPGGPALSGSPAPAALRPPPRREGLGAGGGVSAGSPLCRRGGGRVSAWHPLVLSETLVLPLSWPGGDLRG